MPKKFVISLLAVALTTLLTTDAQAAEVEIGDITFDSKIESMKKAGVGAVVFPHSAHAGFNECSECHPDIFEEKIGANNISMQKNMDGEFCGVCHDSVSGYALYYCSQCHTDIKEKAAE